MKKLIIALLFAAFLPHAALAVSGPTQWSLAGVASWAQPLTASGTALPATASYAIGDLFALYGGAASTTFELYRLCASGTDAVWLHSSGEGGGGISDIIDAGDLPSVTGNAHKALALGTDTASFYWLDIVSALVGKALVINSVSTVGNITASGSITATGFSKTYGRIETTGDAYIGPFNFYALDEQITFTVNASDTVVNKPGYVLVASYTIALGEFYTLAPASSTQALGLSQHASSGGVADLVLWGEALVIVASDSEPILEGDWVITSDTTPGHAMRASVSGDVPLSAEESQRRLGWALYGGAWYNETDVATYVWIYMKGTR